MILSSRNTRRGPTAERQQAGVGGKWRSEKSGDFEKDLRILQNVSTGALVFSKEGLGSSFHESSGMWWRQDYQSSCLLRSWWSRMQPPVLIPVLYEVVSKQQAMMPSESPVVNYLLHCICLHFPVASFVSLMQSNWLSSFWTTNDFLSRIPLQGPAIVSIKVYPPKGTIMCRKCEKRV